MSKREGGGVEVDGQQFTPVMRLGLRKIEVVDHVLEDPELKDCKFARLMGTEGMNALLKCAGVRRHPDKTVVYQAGEGGDALLWIVRGEARLFSEGVADTAELGTAFKGHLLGEQEFLSAADVRRSSVMAAGELTLLEFPRRLAWPTVSKLPDVLAHLEELRTARLRQSEELAAFVNRW